MHARLRAGRSIDLSLCDRCGDRCHHPLPPTHSFPRCELVLIFGTSLMVQPFASLVRFAPNGTPRMLFNRERRGEDLGLDFDTPGTTDGAAPPHRKPLPPLPLLPPLPPHQSLPSH
jgi:hypothetical protein